MAASLHLGPDEIVFLGSVHGATKHSLYQTCQVFVLPTQQENFGFVFVEALASGLPVVTSRDVDLRAELESSDAAMCVARTPESFAAAIVTMLERAARDPGLKQRARQWALRVFDPEVLARRFETMYEQALAHQR